MTRAHDTTRTLHPSVATARTCKCAHTQDKFLQYNIRFATDVALVYLALQA